MTGLFVFLFAVGLALVAGPHVLKGILAACAALNPTSWAVVITLAILVAVLMILLFVNLTAHQKKVVAVTLGSIIAVTFVVIFLHAVLVRASEGFDSLMGTHAAGFRVARYVGIVDVFFCLGWFLRGWYKGRTEYYDDSDSEENGEESESEPEGSTDGEYLTFDSEALAEARRRNSERGTLYTPQHAKSDKSEEFRVVRHHTDE